MKLKRSPLSSGFTHFTAYRYLLFLMTYDEYYYNENLNNLLAICYFSCAY